MRVVPLFALIAVDPDLTVNVPVQVLAEVDLVTVVALLVFLVAFVAKLAQVDVLLAIL